MSVVDLIAATLGGMAGAVLYALGREAVAMRRRRAAHAKHSADREKADATPGFAVLPPGHG